MSKQQTRNLYARAISLGPNNYKWHIVPPDPSDREVLNATACCGRYRVTLNVQSTIRPKTADLCSNCLAAELTGKLWSPSI